MRKNFDLNVSLISTRRRNKPLVPRVTLYNSQTKRVGVLKKLYNYTFAVLLSSLAFWVRKKIVKNPLEQGIFFQHLVWNRVAKLAFCGLVQGKGFYSKCLRVGHWRKNGINGLYSLIK